MDGLGRILNNALYAKPDLIDKAGSLDPALSRLGLGSFLSFEYMTILSLASRGKG